ncbi:MAG: hypothetical protein ACRDZ4_05615 [Egibacteraceae bacterium]
MRWPATPRSPCRPASPDGSRPPTLQPATSTPSRPAPTAPAASSIGVALRTTLHPYLSPAQLAAEAGQALVDLAARNEGHARRLLSEAVEFLTPLTSTGLREDFQRSALLHGCYLALAYLRRGDLEQACATSRTALTRLPGVQSGRCREFLSGLRRQIARRKRNPWVADFLPELDAALAMA